jgi:hypothetical protein
MGGKIINLFISKTIKPFESKFGWNESFSKRLFLCRSEIQDGCNIIKLKAHLSLYLTSGYSSKFEVFKKKLFIYIPDMWNQ